MKKKLLSIVTISYNAERTIENTILSVINQTFDDFEYIIIDGNSSDSTLDIINKYENKISCWISEPDEGLYNAMNKAIKMANGAWIAYMNCGDTYADADVLMRVFKKVIPSDVSVIYGDTLKTESDSSRYERGWPVEFIKKHQPFIHQAAFFSLKDKCVAYFDENFKVASDYNTTFKYYVKYGAKSFLYLPVLICKYDVADGISLRYRKKCSQEYLKIKFKYRLDYWELLKSTYRYFLTIYLQK